MLKIWGRDDGSNVVKVMWCVGELGDRMRTYGLGRAVRGQ